jgi:Fatty acid desaturase
MAVSSAGIGGQIKTPRKLEVARRGSRISKYRTEATQDGLYDDICGLAPSSAYVTAAGLDFPLVRGADGRIENAWAIHQAETTVDFARRSRLAAWLLGGLNFQIEHHVFPPISHVHDPAISRPVIP